MPVKFRHFLKECRFREFQDPFLGFPHPEKIRARQVQHLLQRQFLINRIRPVQRTAVSPLHAHDAGFQVFFQRMVPEFAQVVEPDIRSDLEFQHNLFRKDRLDQLFSLL